MGVTRGRGRRRRRCCERRPRAGRTITARLIASRPGSTDFTWIVAELRGDRSRLVATPSRPFPTNDIVPRPEGFRPGSVRAGSSSDEDHARCERAVRVGPEVDATRDAFDAVIAGSEQVPALERNDGRLVRVASRRRSSPTSPARIHSSPVDGLTLQEPSTSDLGDSIRTSWHRVLDNEKSKTSFSTTAARSCKKISRRSLAQSEDALDAGLGDVRMSPW